MKKIKTLLIGATCFSIGYACQNQGCLIIESGVWACSDFSASMYASPIIQKPITKFGKQFLKMLKSADLVNGVGEIHVLPIADLLCDFIVKNAINVQFEASFIEAKKILNGYEVTYFTREGFKTLHCEKIIDTLSYQTDGNIGKFYCATVQAEGALSCSNGLTFLKEAVGGFILKKEVLIDDSYQTARKKIIDAIKGSNLNVRIYAFAESFGYNYKKSLKNKKDTNYFCIPSLSYGNILAAFEGGATFGEGANED